MTDKKIMKLNIRHKEANIDMGYVKWSSKSKSCSNLGNCEEAVLEGTQVNILDISMCQLPTTTALPLSESTPRRKRSTVNDSVEYKSKRRVSQQTKETGNVSQLLKTDQSLFSTLIENITPIRNSKQKRILIKKSPVSRRLREKLFKNVNGNLCPSISTETISFTQKQMLTQDDSVLQAIDLGIVQTKETGTDEIPDELKNLFASQGFDTCATNAGEFECANDTEQRIVNHNEIHDNLKDLSINWTNESMIHSVLNENKSKCIGLEQTPAITMQEKIRQALVMNAQKPVTPKLFCNENISMDSSKDLSRLDGPFFGLPKKVESLIKSCKGIDKLYEWQEECLNLKALNDRKNLVYALPTSGGKTLVAEILIFREIMCHRRNAIFVLPYVSIVQEKVRSMAPFAVDLDFMLEEYAAGKGQYPPTKRRKRHSVYIATMEKALGIVNSLLETKRMEEIGLVVVDELHLIGDTDSSRSATLEILLTKLRFSARHVQIVGMSATIGNIQEVATFLNAEIYSRNFRPVELKEYVKCERNIFEVNSKLKGSEEMLSLVRTMDMPPPSCNGDQDHIARLVCEVIPHDSCLVFCATKKNCENVALLVSKNLPREILDHRKEEKQALIRTLISELNGSLCPVLQKTLPYGMGYHHSGPIPLHNVQQLKSDLVQAQASLVLLTCLHLLYLVTPYDMVNQITPIPNIYFSVCERLNKKDWQTARVIGFSEATMVKIMKGQRIKSLPERVIKRFYLTLIIYELWNETPVWVVAEKFQLPRGFVQTLMVNSSTFASCVMRFCEELPEFWAFKDLLSSFTQRLSHCCTLELIPLMELPAVKRGRAKQLYNAGFKTITDVANADPKQLVRMVDHLPTRVAKQIVSAAKMLLIQKAETLREEAESVLDGLNIEVKEEVEEET
ncbi:uncharacterized protein LOC126198771 isoform X2 [Schistocerca nitens]|uniref:uncharacterized protein LOC126198771 isoform X2 n=1 Tax=Schistocerca nitens TaxID=7011 RepID=UPI0021178B99|nr:uncharacterized protein LOC126198771 isoform X2 [Schistocerca nitens]